MKTMSRIFAWWISFSGTAVPANTESILPTSAVNIDAATNVAQSVMVCRLTDLGWLDFRGPSVSAYDEAKFDVLTTLKGESVAKIVCSLTILGHPLEAKEKAPAVGENYVIIGNNKEGKFTLQKFMAATPENITKIQRILSNTAPKVSDPAASTTKVLPERIHQGISVPKASEKKAAAKSTTPNEEPVSSTPWSVVAVLTVAATGLLWLLVKKRK